MKTTMLTKPPLRAVLTAVLFLAVLLLFTPAALANGEQLPAPDNLQSVLTTTNTITMSWDSVPGASFYRFYLNGEFVGNTAGTSRTASGLSPNTVYGFKVAAVSSEGTVGLFSNNVYIRTEAQLAAPANLHATSAVDTTITMAWDAVSGADYYRFYQNGSFLKNVYSTSTTLTGLTADTVYGFKVAGVSGTGSLGAYSSNVYVRAPLSAPGNLQSTATTTSAITMSWNAVSDAAYYRFYLNGSYTATVYGTSYTSTGLDADTVYGFKVAAVAASGKLGLYSSNVYIRTEAPLPAPANLRVTNKTSQSIAVAWGAVTGADYYRLYQNGSFLTNVYGTAYTAQGLTANTVYGFKVAAVSSGALGEYSGHLYVRTKLPAPVISSAVSHTADSIALSWTEVPGASYYRLYQNGSFLRRVYATSDTATDLTADTVYGFKVAAVAASGTLGEYSDHVFVRTKEEQIAAPQNLHASSVSSNSIVMAWDAVPGASYYRFYYNGSFLAKVYGTSYTKTGLSPNTVYGFKVAAVSSADTLGDYSANVYVRTLQLAAPQNLRSTAVTNNAVTMAWNAVPGASFYRFYLNGVYVANAVGTTYTATGLSADTVYGFKVAAMSSGGVIGLYSANVYERTRLAAPANLHSAEATANSITMAWNSVPGASYYRIYMGTTEVNTYGLAYTFTGLNADTAYQFKVAAISPTGTLGMASGIVSQSTAKLAAPTNLRAVSSTYNTIVMAWNSVPGAVAYKLYRNESLVATVYGTSYSNENLTSATTYSFKVAAVGSGDKVGNVSAAVSAQTQLMPAPQNLRATSVGTNEVSLQWDAITGASYYKLYRNSAFIANVFGTTYTNGSLSVNTTYSYTVTAVNVNGISGFFSNTLNVTTKLPAPQNLRQTSSTTTSISIAWDSVPGASFYALFRNGVYYKSLYGSYYTDSGLAYNSTFGYQVQAVYGENVSELSSMVFASTIPYYRAVDLQLED